MRRGVADRPTLEIFVACRIGNGSSSQLATAFNDRMNREILVCRIQCGTTLAASVVPRRGAPHVVADAPCFEEVLPVSASTRRESQSAVRRPRASLPLAAPHDRISRVFSAESSAARGSQRTPSARSRTHATASQRERIRLSHRTAAHRRWRMRFLATIPQSVRRIRALSCRGAAPTGFERP